MRGAPNKLATEVLLVQVSADQAEAEKMAVVVNKEAAEAKVQATEVQAIKDDAQQDLEPAAPRGGDGGAGADVGVSEMQ